MTNVGVACTFFFYDDVLKCASERKTWDTRQSPRPFRECKKKRNLSKTLLTSAPYCVVVTYSFSELHEFWHTHSSWNCRHITSLVPLAPTPRKSAILKNVRFSCILSTFLQTPPRGMIGKIPIQDKFSPYPI